MFCPEPAASHWKSDIVRLLNVVPTSGVWSPGSCAPRSLARCAPRRIAELGENPVVAFSAVGHFPVGTKIGEKYVENRAI